MREKPGVSAYYGGVPLLEPGALLEREYVDKRALIHV